LAHRKPRVKVPNRALGEKPMAPFEGFASIFRGSAKPVNSQPTRSEAWLRENAIAVVHLAAISLSKGGATFSFEDLVRAAQKIACDIPISRERVSAVLDEAEVAHDGDRLKLAA